MAPQGIARLRPSANWLEKIMSAHEFAQINNKLNDIEEVAGRIRFRVKKSQKALTTLESKVGVNQTDISAIKDAITTNQAEINKIKAAIAANENGIAAIKAVVIEIKHKTGAFEEGSGDDQLVKKSDLLEFHNKLLQEEKERSRWFKDHRVAIFGVIALLAIHAFDIIWQLVKGTQ